MPTHPLTNVVSAAAQTREFELTCVFRTAARVVTVVKVNHDLFVSGFKTKLAQKTEIPENKSNW
jgi:hypothetical protein